jgi:hypothetical protein
MSSRQERRRREKVLRAAGQAAQRAGLPLAPTNDDLAGFALELAARFGAAGGPEQVPAAVARAFEAACRKTRELGTIACVKGCAFCCHGMVAITAPEAFRIAALVHDREAFGTRAAATVNVAAEARFGRKLPCPLLDAGSGLCTIYAARPLACRAVTSFDVQPCREEYAGIGGTMRVPKRVATHGANHRLAELAALRLAGRPVVLYELSAAVLVVLDSPDAEVRWQAGEDVFAGVRQQMPDAVTRARIEAVVVSARGDER